MRLKKGKKSRKKRGTRYHGKAAKKHKGKGNKGGKGMAGTGKRADQKKTLVLAKMYPYFGKRGFKSRKKIKLESINIGEICDKIEKFLEEGKAKKIGDKIEIILPNYKIIGMGEINRKLVIKAGGFSKSAREKIESLGGECIITKKEENK